MGCWGLYQHLIQRISGKIQEASGPAPQTSQDMCWVSTLFLGLAASCRQQQRTAVAFLERGLARASGWACLSHASSS